MQKNCIMPIHNYLHDGVTLSKIKEIAIRPVADNGLALMTETSAEFASLFTPTPTHIIDLRPESIADFMFWLLPRERYLLPCFKKDATLRTLVDGDRENAIASLEEPFFRVRRFIAYDLLCRGLYLAYWAKKHGNIAKSGTSFEELTAKAVSVVCSTSPDAHFYKRFRGIIVQGGGVGNATTIQLMVQAACDTEVEVDAMSEKALTYHTRMASRVATHVQGTAMNIGGRSHWLAAAMLNRDPSKARAAANGWLEYINTRPAAQLSRFDADFLNRPVLMEQTQIHASTLPPTLLWRHPHAACRDLYYFLACRFLVQSDDTADNERVHGIWQWIMDCKRGTKFKFINGLLKVGNELQQHGDFPPMAEMEYYLEEARVTVNNMYAAARASPHYIRGKPWDAIYKTRFNMSFEKAALIETGMQDTTPAAKLGFDYSVGVFLRNLMQPLRVFSFSAGVPGRYFFVYENKSFMGREKRKEGEALSRELSISFLAELIPDSTPTIVVPVSSGVSGAPLLMPYTVSQIMKASGIYLDLPPGTEREAELAYEAVFFESRCMVYTTTRTALEGDNRWAFEISDAIDVEQHYFDTTPPSDITALSLARLVSQRDSTSWKTVFGYTRYELATALANDVPPGPGHAKGRGRGRGRGRGPG